MFYKDFENIGSKGGFLGGTGASTRDEVGNALHNNMTLKKCLGRMLTYCVVQITTKVSTRNDLHFDRAFLES